MKIDITSFGGIAPKTGRHLLPEGGAVQAVNCRIGSGMLRPLASMRKDHALPPGCKSFYRWKDSWLHYPDYRQYVPGAVYGSGQRLHMCAEAGGLFTWTGEGTECVRLGCPAPESAPVAALSGEAGADVTVQSRAYVYTCVNALGEESAPSPASAVMDWQGQETILSGLTTPNATGHAAIVKKRIYRLAVGTEAADYLFAGEIDADEDSFADSVPDSMLGEVLPSLGWRLPASDLKGLTAVSSGGYAAFHGSEVRFSEPGYPYAWPDSYAFSVEHDIVGIVSSASVLFIFTAGPVYSMSTDELGSSAPARMEELCPCVSMHSIVSVAGGAVFASSDGLYFVGAGYARPMKISGAFYAVTEWRALNPSSMYGCCCNNTLYMFYVRDNGEKGGLILDMGRDGGAENGMAVNLTTTDIAVDHAVVVPQGELMYVAYNGHCWQWEGEKVSTMLSTWRSRSFLLGNTVNFTSCIVEQSIDDDDDDSGILKSISLTKYLESNFGHVNGGVGMLPVAEHAFACDGASADVNAQFADTQPRVTIQVCADNRTVYTRRVLTRDPFVLPAGFTGRTWWVQVKTNRDLRRIALAESMGELYE